MEQGISFSELFRRYRKAYKYNCTQAEIAEKLGYSTETVRSWESGRRFPARTEIPRLAQVMGVGIQEVEDAIRVGHARLSVNKASAGKILPHNALSISGGSLYLESRQGSDDMDKQRRELLRLLSTAGVLLALPHDSLLKALDLEETVALYEDLLALGWESTWRGGIEQFAPRLNRQLARLTTLADKSSIIEQKQWLTLLGRYYQLAMRCAQRQMQTQQALRDAQSSIEVATQLEDAELLASAYFWRARLHLEHKHHELARDDVDAALLYAERVRTPLKGNIYLVAAEVYAADEANSQQMNTRCDQWHEKAATLVYAGGIEDDNSFVKLNVTTVHHERAKTLIQLQRFAEASSELTAAWKTLSPDLLVWHINLGLTEARLYATQKDIEGSTQALMKAIPIANALHAQDKMVQAHSLYLKLKTYARTHPLVCDLGVQLDKAGVRHYLL